MKKNNNNFDPMRYKLIVERASRCISDDEIERIVKAYGSAFAWLEGVDNYPKNPIWVNGDKEERIENPPREWYKPYKHKKALMKVMRKVYLSGYEMDSEPMVVTTTDEPCRCVHLPKADVLIKNCDYSNLFCNVIEDIENKRKTKNYRVYIKDLKEEPMSLEEALGKMKKVTIKHVNLLD